MPGWNAVPPEVNAAAINAGDNGASLEAAKGELASMIGGLDSAQAQLAALKAGFAASMDGAAADATQVATSKMEMNLEAFKTHAKKLVADVGQATFAYRAASSGMVPVAEVMRAKKESQMGLLKSMLPFNGSAAEGAAKYEQYRMINGSAMEEYEAYISNLFTTALPDFDPIPILGGESPGADVVQQAVSQAGSMASQAADMASQAGGMAGQAAQSAVNTAGNATTGITNTVGQAAQSAGTATRSLPINPLTQNPVAQRIVQAMNAPQGPYGLAPNGLANSAIGYAPSMPANHPRGGLPSFSTAGGSSGGSFAPGATTSHRGGGSLGSFRPVGAAGVTSPSGSSFSSTGAGASGGLSGLGAGAARGGLAPAMTGTGMQRSGATFSGVPGPEKTSTARMGGGGMMARGAGAPKRQADGANHELIVAKRVVYDPVKEAEEARREAEKFF